MLYCVALFSTWSSKFRFSVGTNNNNNNNNNFISIVHSKTDECHSKCT